MKKIFLGIFLISVFNILNAQDLSSVYRQVEEVTLNEGLDEDYVDFEGFWKTIKEKHVKEGMQIGWFVWKVDQSSNNNNAWSDYLILNIFANEEQMKEMNSKTPEWWQNEIKTAHKGKTKRSIIKKYTQEDINCIYGLDADLIMLSLSINSQMFLIREEVHFGKVNNCLLYTSDAADE